MKAKLIFIFAIVLFVSIGFFKNNIQSNAFFIACIISAFLLFVYFIFDAIKKPISNRLGILHAILTISGLLFLSFNFYTLVIHPIDATTNATIFVSDLKIIFLNITGFLLFVSGQILFILSLSKKIR